MRLPAFSPTSSPSSRAAMASPPACASRTPDRQPPTIHPNRLEGLANSGGLPVKVRRFLFSGGVDELQRRWLYRCHDPGFAEHARQPRDLAGLAAQHSVDDRI